MTSSRVLSAALVAPAARAWFTRACPARVLNVFDRALNLIDASGEVLSIVAHERGMTPFALALEPGVPSPFEAITAASPVHFHDQQVVIGDVSIEWGHAQPWPPLADWAAVGTALAADAERMEELAALALGADRPAQAGQRMEFAPEGLRPPRPATGTLDACAADVSSLPGFSTLNPPSTTSVTDSVANPPPASLLELHSPNTPASLPPALAARVLAGAADLLNGLLGHDEAQATRGARRLAGAGGGLTPAGDDFAVGVFLAVWAGLYGPGRAELCGPIAAQMAPLTTALSAAYLQAAARGECAAPWHALFAALTEPAATRPRALAEAVAALLAVGHTSGADGLAGFLAYNQSIFRRTHENPD